MDILINTLVLLGTILVGIVSLALVCLGILMIMATHNQIMEAARLEQLKKADALAREEFNARMERDHADVRIMNNVERIRRGFDERC